MNQQEQVKQIRLIQKAADELIKILEDGQGSGQTGMHYLDAKHTQGEWLIEGDGVYALNDKGTNSFCCHIEPSHVPGHDDEETQLHNVLLMGKSPKLLQALFCCVNVMEPGPIRNQAWAAIREATELESKGGD